jgi:ABC-type bacteriocin/lantibiotic exporter with double-glycine peptidase domain
MPRVIRTIVVMLCVGGTLFAVALFAADPSGIWLDVPFVKQKKDGCGAASIAMVMQYWQLQQGRSGDPTAAAEQIQRALHFDAAHGIYASDMERYFRQNGYATFAFAGDWSDLKQHLEKGRPLIAALKPGSMAPLHYVVVAGLVVTGLNQERQLVLVNDPAQRKLLKEDRSRFEQEWKAAGRWTLLALPEAGSH